MSGADETDCCPTCRLVQAPTERCRSCGEGSPTAIEPAVELFLAPGGSKLAPREQKLSEGSWSPLMYLAVLPGTPILLGGVTYLVARFVPSLARTLERWLVGFVVLLMFAWFALIGIIDHYRRVRRRVRPRFSLAPAPPSFRRPPGAMQTGTAERLRGTVRPFLSGEPCLATSVLLAPTATPGSEQRSRDRYLWRTRTVDFVLRGPEHERILVTGELLLDGPARADAMRRGVSPFAEVAQGELSSQALRNTTSSHVEVCLHEGTPVEIAGEITREAVPELVQGYRDAGESLVLRGTPGRPVVVRWR